MFELLHLVRQYGLLDGIRINDGRDEVNSGAIELACLVLTCGKIQEDSDKRQHLVSGYLGDGRTFLVQLSNHRRVEFIDQMISIRRKNPEDALQIFIYPGSFNQNTRTGFQIEHIVGEDLFKLNKSNEGVDKLLVENGKFHNPKANDVLQTLTMYTNLLRVVSAAVKLSGTHKKHPF